MQTMGYILDTNGTYTEKKDLTEKKSSVYF